MLTAVYVARKMLPMASVLSLVLVFLIIRGVFALGRGRTTV
jgi:hypothetical protein